MRARTGWDPLLCVNRFGVPSESCVCWFGETFLSRNIETCNLWSISCLCVMDFIMTRYIVPARCRKLDTRFLCELGNELRIYLNRVVKWSGMYLHVFVLQPDSSKFTIHFPIPIKIECQVSRVVKTRPSTTMGAALVFCWHVVEEARFY